MLRSRFFRLSPLPLGIFESLLAGLNDERGEVLSTRENHSACASAREHCATSLARVFAHVTRCTSSSGEHAQRAPKQCPKLLNRRRLTSVLRLSSASAFIFAPSAFNCLLCLSISRCSFSMSAVASARIFCSWRARSDFCFSRSFFWMSSCSTCADVAGHVHSRSVAVP